MSIGSDSPPERREAGEGDDVIRAWSISATAQHRRRAGEDNLVLEALTIITPYLLGSRDPYTGDTNASSIGPGRENMDGVENLVLKNVGNAVSGNTDITLANFRIRS